MMMGGNAEYLKIHCSREDALEQAVFYASDSMSPGTYTWD
jgi:hypothetical protein